MQEKEALIGIYDEFGNIIGEKKRKNVEKEKDILKVVYILLFDEANRIFMCKFKDTLWKGKFGGSCGGLIKKGENAEDAAKRTMKRELGIETKLNFIGEKYYDFDNIKRFVSVFVGRAKEEIKISSDDIIEGKWIEFEKVKELIKNDKVMPTFKASFDMLGIN